MAESATLARILGTISSRLRKIDRATSSVVVVIVVAVVIVAIAVVAIAIVVVGVVIVVVAVVAFWGR